MRTSGPLAGNLIAIGAGQGRPGAEAQGLKAGAVVSLRVLADLGGGLYRVSAGQTLLTAKSELPLKVGSLFPALVERRGESLSLRPLADRVPLFTRTALPEGADRATGAAVAALLREGLAPRAEALGRVRRAFLRASAVGAKSDDETEADRVELAARMEAAGMPAEDTVLDAIQAEAGGTGGRHSGDRAPEGEAGETGDLPGHDARLPELDRPFALELPEDKLPDFLAALLKGIALRSGGEGCLLQLFNHRPGPTGSWTYAPFAFELDSIAFEGTIRIQSPSLIGGPGRIEAVFLARRGLGASEGAGRRWSIGLDFGAGAGDSLLLGCGDEAAAALSTRRLPELKAELVASGRRAKVAFRGRLGPDRAEGRGGVDVEA